VTSVDAQQTTVEPSSGERKFWLPSRLFRTWSRRTAENVLAAGPPRTFLMANGHEAAYDARVNQSGPPRRGDANEGPNQRRVTSNG
jgi:hypothetical protein